MLQTLIMFVLAVVLIAMIFGLKVPNVDDIVQQVIDEMVDEVEIVIDYNYELVYQDSLSSSYSFLDKDLFEEFTYYFFALEFSLPSESVYFVTTDTFMITDKYLYDTLVYFKSEDIFIQSFNVNLTLNFLLNPNYDESITIILEIIDIQSNTYITDMFDITLSIWKVGNLSD